MTRKKHENINNEGDVDMTPMLDIVFILLIFFIVTTSFIKEEGLEVNRPKANKSSKSNSPVIVVTINDSGLVSLNGKLVDIERLAARIESYLATNNTNSAVVIPSYDTSHDHVVQVIDKIKTFDHLTISIGK
ncbi:ExbD/TolR family protein [Thalassotalea castellviae]|uniref:Biopolymer transporter ExbD n=1 Tax=Thalassotalea castellviae TaxID=3075612 RepID=A0ABU3A3N6_9GAMM|nr:biopolymer transporter ExbD [Thalassotalea sp. W431]MDT0604430.1 biopolymer transporter ExbD [Thalassotalea sp. W431]